VTNGFFVQTGVAIASDWCKSDLRGTAHIVENQVLDIFARAKEAEKAFEAFAFIRKNSSFFVLFWFFFFFFLGF
jgi:hypothetical protein